MTPVAPMLDSTVIAAFRSGTLTPEQAEAVLPRDRAAAVFFLLHLSTALGSHAPAGGAHTPSGAVPPYANRTVVLSAWPGRWPRRPGRRAYGW